MGPTLRGVSGERIKKKIRALNLSRVGLDQGRGSLRIGGVASLHPTISSHWLAGCLGVSSFQARRQGVPKLSKRVGLRLPGIPRGSLCLSEKKGCDVPGWGVGK